MPRDFVLVLDQDKAKDDAPKSSTQRESDSLCDDGVHHGRVGFTNDRRISLARKSVD
jgi:hypothetical protein